MRPAYRRCIPFPRRGLEARPGDFREARLFRFTEAREYAIIDMIKYRVCLLYAEAAAEGMKP